MDQAGADEKVVIRAPRGAAYAIERAAIQAHMTPGDLARRLLIDGLRANGFELADQAPWRTADVLPFRRP
jgi:hypothetical protein